MTRPNWKEQGTLATEIQMHCIALLGSCSYWSIWIPLWKLWSVKSLYSKHEASPESGKSQGILPTDGYGLQTIDSTITQIEPLERQESTQRKS